MEDRSYRQITPEELFEKKKAQLDQWVKNLTDEEKNSEPFIFITEAVKNYKALRDTPGPAQQQASSLLCQQLDILFKSTLPPGQSSQQVWLMANEIKILETMLATSPTSSIKELCERKKAQLDQWVGNLTPEEKEAVPFIFIIQAIASYKALRGNGTQEQQKASNFLCQQLDILFKSTSRLDTSPQPVWTPDKHCQQVRLIADELKALEPALAASALESEVPPAPPPLEAADDVPPPPPLESTDDVPPPPPLEAENDIPPPPPLKDALTDQFAKLAELVERKERLEKAINPPSVSRRTSILSDNSSPEYTSHNEVMGAEGKYNQAVEAVEKIGKLYEEQSHHKTKGAYIKFIQDESTLIKRSLMGPEEKRIALFALVKTIRDKVTAEQSRFKSFFGSPSKLSVLLQQVMNNPGFKGLDAKRIQTQVVNYNTRLKERSTRERGIKKPGRP